MGIVGLIAGGSKGFQKLNSHLLSGNAPMGQGMAKAAKAAPKRIRQNSAGLNKTEQAFKEHLEAKYDDDLIAPNQILSQAVTLKLGNGVRYTPDFMLFWTDSSNASSPTAWEVKGFIRDDAAVKLKVAASQYPWIKFHLVTRKKGEWQIERVLP
jgi:hypothetical protein